MWAVIAPGSHSALRPASGVQFPARQTASPVLRKWFQRNPCFLYSSHLHTLSGFPVKSISWSLRGSIVIKWSFFLPPPPVVGAPLQVHPWHFAYRLFLFLTLLILCSSFLPTCDSGETKLFIFTLWPIKTTSTVDLLVERIIIFWGRFFLKKFLQLLKFYLLALD